MKFSSLLFSSLLFSSLALGEQEAHTDYPAPPIEPSDFEVNPAESSDRTGDFGGFRGRADIGLADLTKQAATDGEVLRVLQDFLDAQLGMHVPFAIERSEVIGDGFVTYTLFPKVGDFSVLDREFRATFWSDGKLYSLYGDARGLESLGERSRQAQLTYARALQHMNDFAIGEMQVREGLLEEGELFAEIRDGRYRSSRGSKIELSWSVDWNSLVWRGFFEKGVFLIDDESGVVLEGNSNQLDITGPCNLRVRKFTETNVGRPNSLRLHNNWGGHRFEEVTCEGFSVGAGDCAWRLERDPWGYENGVERVQDFDGAEAQLTQSCNSVPAFTASNGDATRETGAFYVANQMRWFMLDNVWSNSPFSYEHEDVEIEVDNSTANTAFFSPFCAASSTCPTITCNDAGGPLNSLESCAMDTLSHEYGHYVHWTLGHDAWTQSCTAGVNEKGSLNETFANAFALIFWLDDPESAKAEYGATNGGALFNFPVAHLTGDNGTQHNPHCSGGPNNNGWNDASIGQPFLEALWEVLFNRDCTGPSTCVAATPHHPRSFPNITGDVFAFQGQESILSIMGDALGFAIEVTPTATSHQMIVDEMVNRIATKFQFIDPTIAPNVMSVFEHHGFVCNLPGGC